MLSDFSILQSNLNHFYLRYYSFVLYFLPRSAAQALLGRKYLYIDAWWNPYSFFRPTKGAVALRLRTTVLTTIHLDQENGTWTGLAKIPVDLLPTKVDRFMTASLHGTRDNRQYETLYPIPGEKPDLHQPEKFGEIDLDGLFPGFRQRTVVSVQWQKALDNPVITETVFYMWDGTPIEDDHDHKNQFCTFFFKGKYRYPSIFAGVTFLIILTLRILCYA